MRFFSLAQVTALAQRGLLDVHIERFALRNALQAYHRLARGDIEGRAVVVPG